MKVKIKIKYKEELVIWAKILFIKIKLFPRPEKKKKAKKKNKPKKKKSKPSTEDTEEKIKIPLTENIKIITDVVKLLLGRFAKHFHIKIAKINISVATGDPASTAILYGAVSASVALLVDALDSVTNLDRLKKAKIDVFANYSEEKTKAEIDLTFSLRIIGLLDIGLKSLFRYLKLSSRAKARHSKK